MKKGLPSVFDILQRARNCPNYCSDEETVRKYASYYVRMLAKITKQAKAGNTHALAKTVNHLLASKAAIFCCLLLSHKDFPKENLEQLAATINPFKPIDEPVLVWTRKEDKKQRPLCSFGPKRRAAQRLCRDIMIAAGMLLDYDFTVAGKGAPKACQQIAKLAEENAYGYVIVADIKDCFPSLEPVGQGLILPDEVIRNAVLIASDVRVITLPQYHGQIIQELEQAVRRGLPQGSSASGIIASWLLGRMLGTLNVPSRVVLYGDDIAIASKTLSEAKGIKKALFEAAKNNASGSLALKLNKIFNIEDGVTFVMYKIRRKCSYSHAWYHYSPAQKCFDRLKDKLERDFIQNGASVNINNPIVARWLNAFPLWLNHEGKLPYLENDLGMLEDKLRSALAHNT
jgi:hypothetical protein